MRSRRLITLDPDADLTTRHLLVQEDALAACGEHLRALQAIPRTYEAGVNVFEEKHG